MSDSILDNIIPAMDDYQTKADTVFPDMKDKIEEVADAIGVEPDSLDEMVTTVTEDIEDMYDEGYNAIDMMWDQLDAIYDLQQAYLDWADAVMEVIR